MKAVPVPFRKAAACLALAAGLLGAPGPAFSLGGTDAGSPPAAARPAVAPAAGKPAAKPQPGRAQLLPRSCTPGKSWNARRHACVRTTAALVRDHALMLEGRRLALAGRYREAIATLQSIADKSQDVMAFTYLGYSHRKLGDTDTGIAYYHKALAIDPDSLNTHEYLGEGYVTLGRLPAAKAELATVERLCGTRACIQYQALSGALAGRSTY